MIACSGRSCCTVLGNLLPLLPPLLLLLCRVVVTGHSLGAALATLGAFWLKTIMPSVSDSYAVLLLFGCRPEWQTTSFPVEGLFCLLLVRFAGHAAILVASLKQHCHTCAHM
jgi:hypothetical protein